MTWAAGSADASLSTTADSLAFSSPGCVANTGSLVADFDGSLKYLLEENSWKDW
jgi:hypothetical protein